MIHIFPRALRCENGIGILWFAARAVVAAQGHEHVAAFAIQVVAQDDAAKAQVGLHVKEFAGVAVADDAGPEGHDLHVAARADDGDGVFAKAAFYLDEAQHERGFQPGAAGFVPDGLQKVHAAVEVGHALVEAVAHGREPAQVGQAGGVGPRVPQPRLDDPQHHPQETERHQSDAQEEGGEAGDVAEPQEVPDDRNAQDDGDDPREEPQGPVEEDGALIAHKTPDEPQDLESIGEGVELGLRSGGALLEADRHLDLGNAQSGGMHRQLGLDLELPAHGGEGLDEPAREDAVAGEHIGDMGPEDPGGQAVEGLVTGLVARAVGALLLHVTANAQDVVIGPLQEGRDHAGQGGGVVGVIAVDHDVDIGLDIGEGPTDHVALALALLAPNDGTGGRRDLGGAIGRAVVIDEDAHRGNGRQEVGDDLRDRALLVVARDDRCDIELGEIHLVPIRTSAE